MSKVRKIDIWTPIVSVVLFALLIFISIQFQDNKELKKAERLLEKEKAALVKQILESTDSIDKLTNELVDSSLFINKIEQQENELKILYHEYKNSLTYFDTLSIDSNMQFFAKRISEEISNR